MNQVGVEGYYYYNCLGSDFMVRPMAEEDESRAQTSTTLYEPDTESGYIPKDEEKANNNNSSNWLQLSVGSCHQGHSALTTTKYHQISKGDHQMAPIIGSGLIELDLLPDNRSHNYNWSSSPTMFSGRSCQGGSSFGSASLLLEQTSMSIGMPNGPFSAQAFGNIQQQNHSMPIMPSSSFVTTSSSSYSLQSSSSFRPLGSYFATPFPHFPSSSSSSGFHQLDLVAGPTSDVTTVRVVDPPTRPHSGIWFMLQASQNQGKEPLLPQIPKTYLRIKDGKMTVRLILKYLVSKLRLENESEIEITCRGQQLVPFLTLQHVRDNIWTQRNDTKTLLSDSSSSTSDHVMVLHYCRTIS